MRLLYCFVLWLSILTMPCHALSVGEEVVVAQPDDFIFGPGDDYVPDGTFSMVKQGQVPRWILPLWDRRHGGIVHLLTEGPLERPMQSKIGLIKRAHFFSNAKLHDGSLWITNTYADKTGILAFVHAESVDSSASPGLSGKSRIGLAWSSNGGDSFQYLGGIISAYGDPNPHNVQGGIYIIRDGFFYVYFHDTKGITVARSPIDEVLSAARSGKVSSWKKYMGTELGFASSGLAGDSYPIGVRGVSHNDATCSSYNNLCYLVLTMMSWGGKESTIKLFESSDGIQWKTVAVISALPPSPGVRGYQYAAIASEIYYGMATVGKRFYIYSAKNHMDSDRQYVRWTVDLGN